MSNRPNNDDSNNVAVSAFLAKASQGMKRELVGEAKGVGPSWDANRCILKAHEFLASIASIVEVAEPDRECVLQAGREFASANQAKSEFVIDYSLHMAFETLCQIKADGLHWLVLAKMLEDATYKVRDRLEAVVKSDIRFASFRWILAGLLVPKVCPALPHNQEGMGYLQSAYRFANSALSSVVDLDRSVRNAIMLTLEPYRPLIVSMAQAFASHPMTPLTKQSIRGIINDVARRLEREEGRASPSILDATEEVLHLLDKGYRRPAYVEQFAATRFSDSIRYSIGDRLSEDVIHALREAFDVFNQDQLLKVLSDQSIPNGIVRSIMGCARETTELIMGSSRPLFA